MKEQLESTQRSASSRRSCTCGETSRASSAVSAGQLSVVADQMRERSFKAGSVLMRDGEAPVAAYSLVRGDVRVSRRGQVLGEVGPGAAVGIGGIVSRDALGLGAVATTDVLALELDRETLVDIFDDFFPFLLEAIKESVAPSSRLRPENETGARQLAAIHPRAVPVGRIGFRRAASFSQDAGRALRAQQRRRTRRGRATGTVPVH